MAKANRTKNRTTKTRTATTKTTNGPATKGPISTSKRQHGTSITTNENDKYTPKDIIAIVKRYLLVVDSVAVSELEDEIGVSQSVLEGWKDKLFEKGAVVFRNRRGEMRKAEEYSIGRQLSLFQDVEEKEV